MSDRDVPAMSPQTMLHDLEAVVDVLALERFALLGYREEPQHRSPMRVRYPHRVWGLVLAGG